MHNGVVVAIAQALASAGVTVLRFNFRGVGASEGAYDEGRGERHDIAGALDRLLAQPGVDPSRVFLVGYSFGACVGLAHALTDPRVAALVAVGLSVEFCDFGSFQTFAEEDEGNSGSAPMYLAFPKLFITGERDRLAPPSQLLRLVERLPEPKSVQIVPGVDHFWWGSEQEVGRRVAAFVTDLWTHR
jgi:alpha/beta superfamily hydrolase